jgi:uncharacterized protein YaaR (DUF327 family)
VNDKPSKGIVKFIIGVAFVVGAAWLVLNRQAVVDWYRIQIYTPTAEIKQLAANDQLEQRGQDLFYASQPQIQDSAAFNQSCPKDEQTIVLGCYKAQQIYLYNVKDARFDGVKEVTAAHEMLHAGYERLSETDKERVNAILKPIVDGMQDKRILDLIALYNKTEPGELYNEMHSILGTEYANLPAELETYYKHYFKDRSKIVAYANQYQTVFTDSKSKINEYDQQLNAIKPQIDHNNATLQQMQSELQSENSQLDQLRSQDRIQQYNQMVPEYNQRVVEFNSLIEQTRLLVSQYNTIVEERNKQATAQNDLYQGLNSDYQPVQQSQ